LNIEHGPLWIGCTDRLRRSSVLCGTNESPSQQSYPTISELTHESILIVSRLHRPTASIVLISFGPASALLVLVRVQTSRLFVAYIFHCTNESVVDRPYGGVVASFHLNTVHHRRECRKARTPFTVDIALHRCIVASLIDPMVWSMVWSFIVLSLRSAVVFYQAIIIVGAMMVRNPECFKFLILGIRQIRQIPNSRFPPYISLSVKCGSVIKHPASVV
jgi:hypothetical protein